MTLAAAIIETLQTDVPGLALIEGAAGFQSAAETNPKATPAAYVFVVDETGDELTLDGTLQMLRVTVAVVLVVRHLGTSKGGSAAGDMESLREDVLAALIGKVPTGCSPLSLRQSALIAFRDGHLWWQQTWETRRFISGV